MMLKRITLVVALLFLLVWSVGNLKKASAKLGFEKFNEEVNVEVVDLPLCNRSNPIVVLYKGQRYTIEVNKNDCIQGKYSIGDTIKATYNRKVDEMNPKSFLGVYRISKVIVIIISLIIVAFFTSIYFQDRK